jgi:drug/metabolite transporter (DMT)-like permease
MGRFPALHWPAGLAILYLAVLPSVLCHLVWFSVIRRNGASLGAMSLFVQPVVGALLGILLLREPVTVGLVTGAVLIFVALYLTTLPKPASQVQVMEKPL